MPFPTPVTDEDWDALSPDAFMLMKGIIVLALPNPTGVSEEELFRAGKEMMRQGLIRFVTDGESQVGLHYVGPKGSYRYRREEAIFDGVYAKAKHENDQAVIKCPHCKKKHFHGWGTGYRGPHCTDPAMRAKGDYFVDCGDD